MRSESTSTKDFPWYLLWVFGALALAVVNIGEFIAARNSGSAVIAVAWLCWAFSWYAKPFHVRLRSGLSEAVASQPVRPWVPRLLWSVVTCAALALLVIGLAVKFSATV